MESTEEHEENEGLKKLAPTLFSIHKPTRPSVPNNYFDHLTSHIQERITKQTKSPFLNLFLKFKKKHIAIGFASLSIGAFILIKSQNSHSLIASDIFTDTAFVEIEDMSTSAIIDELISFSLEEEAINLLDHADENLVLAALDNDELFNDFFNSEAMNEELLSSANNNELEMIESYFRSQEFDLNFITN